MKEVLYYLYERQLLRQMRSGPMLAHVGIILDGNRRYGQLFLLCRSTIAAAHGSSFIKSTAGRAPLRALDVLEGSRLLAPVKR